MVTLLSFLTSKTFLKTAVLQKYTKHTSYCAYPAQTATILDEVCIMLCIFEVEFLGRFLNREKHVTRQMPQLDKVDLHYKKKR